MMTQPNLDLYSRLLAISDEAFAAQWYEVAYHALVAALHCADLAHDQARLAEVAALAEAQQAGIATESPDHLIAPQSAQRRGNRSVYDSLLLQVNSMQLRARSLQAMPE